MSSVIGGFRSVYCYSNWSVFGDANNHIAVHRQQTNHNIDWDPGQCLTYSINYFQRLTLESWYTDWEQTPLNRCQPLLAPHPDNHNIQTTDTPGFKPFTMLIIIYALINYSSLFLHTKLFNLFNCLIILMKQNNFGPAPQRFGLIRWNYSLPEGQVGFLNFISPYFLYT